MLVLVCGFKSFALLQHGLTSYSILIKLQVVREREKQFNGMFCVMGDTCLHRDLQLVWESEMTNHASEVSVGVCFSASEWVRVWVPIVTYHLQPFALLPVPRNSSKPWQLWLHLMCKNMVINPNGKKKLCVNEQLFFFPITYKQLVSVDLTWISRRQFILQRVQNIQPFNAIKKKYNQ